MARVHRQTAAVVIMVLAVATLGSAPAAAGTRTVSDPSGDAVPTLDITSVRYTNNDTSVVFVWRLRKVANVTRLIGTTLDSCDGLCSDYYQYRVGKVNGKPKARVYRGLASGGFKQRRCRGAKVAWRPAKRLVRARVPKRCIVGPGKLYMQSWSSKKWTGAAADVTRGRVVARG